MNRKRQVLEESFPFIVEWEMWRDYWKDDQLELKKAQGYLLDLKGSVCFYFGDKKSIQNKDVYWVVDTENKIYRVPPEITLDDYLPFNLKPEETKGLTIGEFLVKNEITDIKAILNYHREWEERFENGGLHKKIDKTKLTIYIGKEEDDDECGD